MSRCSARCAITCCKSARSSTPIRSTASSCRNSKRRPRCIRAFAARFDPACRTGDAAIKAADETLRESHARRRQPVRRRDPAGAGEPHPRRRAHERLSAARAARVCDQGRQRAGRGHGVAAAVVRDLRAFAQARRDPPARRQGRAWRPALERPPRRFPHRDSRPDEDADGQERDHRAGRLQRRLRAQGPAAAAAGARRLSRRSLSRVRLRPPRRHRQHRRRRRSCIRRRSCATTTTIRIWLWPPTRAPPTCRTPPTRSRRSTGSGSATRSPLAGATATTTRRKASPRGARGSASRTTSAPWA